MNWSLPASPEKYLLAAAFGPPFAQNLAVTFVAQTELSIQA
jgi:hypothetical protein